MTDERGELLTVTFCPKCRKRYKEASSSFDVNEPLTCASCRQSFYVDELITETGQSLPEFLAENPSKGGQGPGGAKLH